MIYKTDFSLIDTDKYYFDEKAADSAVRYIETNIKHVAGELSGQYLKLEEWQKNEIIKPIFGWKKKADGYRKYTSAYIEIPKKNGKTFLAASFAALFLDVEGEKGDVPIFSIAGNKDQADLTFNATKGIISQSRRLSGKMEIYKNSITVKKKDSFKYFRGLASKSETQQGVNPQLVIADEVHIHKDSDLIENQRKSMVARKQPLFLMITTAGSDLYGVGYQEHTYARDVAKGVKQDEGLLVCIYGANKDDDPFSEDTWKKVNPNYNVSVNAEGMMREANRAKASKVKLNSFLRYHLNIWTQSKSAWIDDAIWMKSQWEIDESEYAHLPCMAGLDLSTRSDITALSLVWKLEDGRYVCKNWYFLPETKGTKSADDGNLYYADWVNDGLIEEVYGSVVDYEFVIDKIFELKAKYEISAFAYDPWNMASIAPKLEDEGIELVEFRQGYKSMNEPTKEIEAAIMKKRYNHQGDPILRWMAGNAEVQSDPAGNVKIVKDARFPEKKVDGIISNIMAFGLWIGESVDKGSYLEEGNLWFV